MNCEHRNLPSELRALRKLGQPKQKYCGHAGRRYQLNAGVRQYNLALCEHHLDFYRRAGWQISRFGVEVGP